MRNPKHLLTPAGWLWGVYLSIVLLFLAALLTTEGCAALNLESRATALYGTFSVAQDTALEIMRSPAIDDAKKLKIQQADAKAKPFADALLGALQEYRKFDGETQTESLKQELTSAAPAIAEFSAETKL